MGAPFPLYHLPKPTTSLKCYHQKFSPCQPACCNQKGHELNSLSAMTTLTQIAHQPPAVSLENRQQCLLRRDSEENLRENTGDCGDILSSLDWEEPESPKLLGRSVSQGQGNGDTELWKRKQGKRYTSWSVCQDCSGKSTCNKQSEIIAFFAQRSFIIRQLMLIWNQHHQMLSQMRWNLESCINAFPLKTQL